MAIDVLLSKPNRGYTNSIRVSDFEDYNPHMIITPVDGDEEILFPMPSSILSNDTPIWEMQSFGDNGLAKTADLAGKVTNAGAMEAAKGTVKDMAGITMSNVGLAGDSFDLALHNSGKMFHPLKEMMFRGADYRRFTFEWALIPLNSRDQEGIRQAIKSFQRWSVPIQKWKYQGYPSLWWITWVPSEDNLPVIMDCAITNIDIDYGGVGKPVFHDDLAGIQTNITVEFTEVELHTRDKVDAGVWG